MYNDDSYRKHQAYIEQKSDENYIRELYNDGSPIQLYNRVFFEYLDPIIEPQSSWLTVGDSTGIDAAYIKQNGGKATATDLSDRTLQRIYEQKLIDGYAIQNVEKMTYVDSEYDYVCCKEAYHHFPRPAIGFYEMLRVAKKGVVIVEPTDINLSYPPLMFVRNIFDRFNTKLLQKFWKNQYSYEVVGNFVYKISFREFEKMAVALDMPCIAYAGFNTSMTARHNSPFVQNLKRGFTDLLCKLSLLPYHHLSIIVFKEKPSDVVRQKLSDKGYKIYDLPKNPYN